MSSTETDRRRWTLEHHYRAGGLAQERLCVHLDDSLDVLYTPGWPRRILFPFVSILFFSLVCQLRCGHHLGSFIPFVYLLPFLCPTPVSFPLFFLYLFFSSVSAAGNRQIITILLFRAWALLMSFFFPLFASHQSPVNTKTV